MVNNANISTLLGQEAKENLDTLKIYITDDEYNHCLKGIENFDSDLQLFGFPAIQAKQKLEKIKDMSFDDMRAYIFTFNGQDILTRTFTNG